MASSSWFLSVQFAVKPREKISFGRQLFGALQNTLLEIAIQSFEYAGLAMQIGEDSDFGAQQFGNNRNRNVIHRAVLVTFELVEVSKVNSGDKNDGGALETRDADESSQPIGIHRVPACLHPSALRQSQS